jgi:riboflavin kinase/FMN adenylyltransferase
MQVHRDIEHLPVFRNAVITIGTFDGVHLGHKEILAALREEAERIQGESVIISFDPHPRKVISPHASLQLINTPDEKTALLRKEGIDHLVIVPFTAEFSGQPAVDYIRNFLVGRFHPAVIIIGFDHHFGKNREGNYLLLEQKKEEYGFRLVEIPQHVMNQAGISSTRIREAILNGDIHTANDLLGYPFSFEGKVVKGDQLGRKLGYPTANLVYTYPDKIHLGEGVYAVQAEFYNGRKKGMLSIGKRPTLNDTETRVEVYLFDFEGDLYDQTIRVTVREWLRSQIRFDNLEDLVQQMDADREKALSVLTH